MSREIGESCGFESLYAFSRAFRKAYGIPPRTYRQLVQEGGPLPVSGKNSLICRPRRASLS